MNCAMRSPNFKFIFKLIECCEWLHCIPRWGSPAHIYWCAMWMGPSQTFSLTCVHSCSRGMRSNENEVPSIASRSQPYCETWLTQWSETILLVEWTWVGQRSRVAEAWMCVPFEIQIDQMERIEFAMRGSWFVVVSQRNDSRTFDTLIQFDRICLSFTHEIASNTDKTFSVFGTQNYSISNSNEFVAMEHSLLEFVLILISRQQPKRRMSKARATNECYNRLIHNNFR